MSARRKPRSLAYWQARWKYLKARIAAAQYDRAFTLSVRLGRELALCERRRWALRGGR